MAFIPAENPKVSFVTVVSRGLELKNIYKLWNKIQSTNGLHIVKYDFQIIIKFRREANW